MVLLSFFLYSLLYFDVKFYYYLNLYKDVNINKEVLVNSFFVVLYLNELCFFLIESE